MKKKIIILSIITAFILVISVGMSLAVFTSKDTEVNSFLTGDIKGEIEEPGFNSPINWNGQQYDKVVKIKNIGKNESFVRVSIIPRWVDENNNPWSGDVSSNVVSLNFVNLIDVPTNNEWTSDKWVKGSDGFYYYTSILHVGESTEQLLNSVKATINDDTVEYPEDYEGKYLNVDVKVESVQVTSEAYNYVWNIPENIKPLFVNLTSK